MLGFIHLKMFYQNVCVLQSNIRWAFIGRTNTFS